MENRAFSNQPSRLNFDLQLNNSHNHGVMLVKTNYTVDNRMKGIILSIPLIESYQLTLIYVSLVDTYKVAFNL